MRSWKEVAGLVMLLGVMGIAHADEKEELLKLKNTTVNLIKQLVKQGILTDKMAGDMIKQAESDAVKQVASSKAAPAKTAPAAAGDAGGTASASANQAEAVGEAGANATAKAATAVPADEIRVSYVPDFVKDDIRQQVRAELRDQVVGDVMQKAKDEQWGMPNALPEWTRRFTLSGDIRLREQTSEMGSDNITYAQNFAGGEYLNFNTINAAFNQSGAPTRSNLGQAAYYNTQVSQNLARERFRLGFDVKVADNVDAGIRLATGNTQNPVSTNQTLGNTGLGYQFAVDRAYLKYSAFDSKHYNWLTLVGGRTANPFFTGGSELVWDEDLSFEGAAFTVRQPIKQGDMSDDVGGKGPVVFATAGVFPQQASNSPAASFFSLQKWLLGAQGGLDWSFDNQDSLKFGTAYYDYQNITAKVNNTNDPYCGDSTTTANMIQSAPVFTQGGNSMVGICYEGTQANNTGLYGLYGLASAFKILDINAAYDMAMFAPVHVKLSGDYANNIGYNVPAGYVVQTAHNTPGRQATGWQVRLDVGWPKIDAWGHWNMFTGYRSLGRDAVIDSYADSDFHLGGTNYKGWMIGGNYGLMKNIWLTGRWMSADVITGPTYGIDMLQIDLNSRF